jgi:hypothetical protein
MSNLNFQTMSRKELHAYVLAHRDDQEAFYIVSRLTTVMQGFWAILPSFLAPEYTSLL